MSKLLVLSIFSWNQPSFAPHSIEIGLQFSQDSTTMSIWLFRKQSTVLDPFKGPTKIVFDHCDPADQN